MHYVRLMKSLMSESKPFQSRNSRLSQAGGTAYPLQIETVEPFSTDSDAELFMYLIRGIRFGS